MFAYYADARKHKLPTFLTDHRQVRPPAVSACNANTLVNINNQNDKYKWKRSGVEDRYRRASAWRYLSSITNSLYSQSF